MFDDQKGGAVNEEAAPSWLIVVPDLDDAEMLRSIGRNAISMTEHQRLDRELPRGPGSEVLCVGLAQNIAGDLRLAGVETTWGVHVPLGHLSIALYLEHVAKREGYDVASDELDQFVCVIEGGAFKLEGVKPTGHPNAPGHTPILEVFSLSDLANMPARLFVVDGLFHDDSLTALVGKFKSFKTTLADHLSVAVADGGEFLGRKVMMPGLVIDCALEGVHGKKARYQAHLGLARFNDPTDPVHQRLFLMRTVPDITTMEGQDQLLRTIDAVCTKTGEQLRLLRIDTVARGMSLCRLDENSAADMGKYMAGCDRIRVRFPSLQLLVHHTGKSGLERGSTALPGAADLIMFIEKQGKTEAKVWVRDARDIEVPEPWTVTFASVVVGQHENGRPITGLRVDTVQTAPEDWQQPKATGIASDEAAWQVLRAAGTEGCTRAQVVAGCPDFAPTTIWDALNRLLKTSPPRAVSRKGNPVRYWDAAQTPDGDPGIDPGKIRPDVPPDLAPTAIMLDEDPGIRTAPYKGAGPDLRPDVRGAESERTEADRKFTSDDWCTPPHVVEVARGFMGTIDVDPATSPFAQKYVKATTTFTIEQDGLSKPWPGRVWLNPPYSQPAIDRFVNKLVESFTAGITVAALLLTNSQTSAAWYQLALARSSVCCFFSKRLSFERPDGSGPQKGIRFSQVLFYFGDNVAGFRQVFEKFGRVLVNGGGRREGAA